MSFKDDINTKGVFTSFSADNQLIQDHLSQSSDTLSFKGDSYTNFDMFNLEFKLDKISGPMLYYQNIGDLVALMAQFKVDFSEETY